MISWSITILASLKRPYHEQQRVNDLLKTAVDTSIESINTCGYLLRFGLRLYWFPERVYFRFKSLSFGHLFYGLLDISHMGSFQFELRIW
jgi:hypothetical protein